jgi:2-polyprenyl-3-methyl-5-hydroxy-6-metoxy-1,4-benzoquinol methylase
LLDIGCGQGSFLHLASSLGWETKGIDFDPEAVKFGRMRGFDISTDSLEDLVASRARFDAVTLSQVIEHLADPLQALHGIHDLLRPGGFLFLSTPNAAGRGHRRFGEFWQGPEVPRHIVVFSGSELCQAMVDAGFEDVRLHENPEADWQLYMKSWLLSQGRRPKDTGSIPRRQRLRLLMRSMTDPGEPDGLILTARRPSADRDGGAP